MEKIITSGTISPLEMYPRILNFTPVLTKRFQVTRFKQIEKTNCNH